MYVYGKKEDTVEETVSSSKRELRRTVSSSGGGGGVVDAGWLLLLHDGGPLYVQAVADVQLLNAYMDHLLITSKSSFAVILFSLLKWMLTIVLAFIFGVALVLFWQYANHTQDGFLQSVAYWLSSSCAGRRRSSCPYRDDWNAESSCELKEVMQRLTSQDEEGRPEEGGHSGYYACRGVGSGAPLGGGGGRRNSGSGGRSSGGGGQIDTSGRYTMAWGDGGDEREGEDVGGREGRGGGVFSRLLSSSTHTTTRTSGRGSSIMRYFRASSLLSGTPVDSYADEEEDDEDVWKPSKDMDDIVTYDNKHNRQNHNPTYIRQTAPLDNSPVRTAGGQRFVGSQEVAREDRRKESRRLQEMVPIATAGGGVVFSRIIAGEEGSLDADRRMAADNTVDHTISGIASSGSSSGSSSGRGSSSGAGGGGGGLRSDEYTRTERWGDDKVGRGRSGGGMATGNGTREDSKEQTVCNSSGGTVTGSSSSGGTTPTSSNSCSAGTHDEEDVSSPKNNEKQIEDMIGARS
eukprot:GHVS01051886.1.p1 GENE.GHVS01051886.1~~GHVS01051886.1.p1  ORF type:complete len:608 (+),score=210.42 GHVS01051886.1:275-1825(+)